MRLLLIEDNERLAGFVARALQGAGFAVDHCTTANDGEAALATVRYAVLVLDLGLPDDDGMNLLRRVRSGTTELPILVLTARDGLDDRVKGLNAGADDYLLKPFAMEELVARINALLRRPGNALGHTLTVGNLSFDTVGREVRVGGDILALARRETSVLEQLMRRSGRVVPKDVLCDSVYGFEENFGINSIEVAVHRLRKRLQDVGATIRIHTLRGIGYLLTTDGPLL